MKVADAHTLSLVLDDVGIDHGDVTGTAADGFVVPVSEGCAWTYDQMAELAGRVGTTDISFRWNGGWGGSDVTPGDPSECFVEIGMMAARERRAAEHAEATRERVVEWTLNGRVVRTRVRGPLNPRWSRGNFIAASTPCPMSDADLERALCASYCVSWRTDGASGVVDANGFLEIQSGMRVTCKRAGRKP